MADLQTCSASRASRPRAASARSRPAGSAMSPSRITCGTPAADSRAAAIRRATGLGSTPAITSGRSARCRPRSVRSRTAQVQDLEQRAVAAAGVDDQGRLPAEGRPVEQRQREAQERLAARRGEHVTAEPQVELAVQVGFLAVAAVAAGLAGARRRAGSGTWRSNGRYVTGYRYCRARESASSPSGVSRGASPAARAQPGRARISAAPRLVARSAVPAAHRVHDRRHQVAVEVAEHLAADLGRDAGGGQLPLPPGQARERGQTSSVRGPRRCARPAAGSGRRPGKPRRVRS